MKYNYVIFGDDSDFLKLPFSDITGNENVKYIGGRIDSKNKILNFLCRVHFNGRINKIIPLPFKKIWYPLAFKGKFNDDKPICFIIFAGSIYCNLKFIAFLRKKYKDCKVAIYSQDIIAKNKNKKIVEILSACDVNAVYDKGDAVKYDAIHFPAVYSFVPVKTQKEEFDVCCILKAKDRLSKAVALYDRLNKLGLKTYFYITGVDKKNRVEREGIIYGDVVPYKDILEIVAKSKVVAEIIQGDSVSYTYRPCEAIFYGKKLLTDNVYTEKEFFYSPENVLCYGDVNEINKEFFKTPAKWDQSFKERFSPLRLLESIDEKL